MRPAARGESGGMRRDVLRDGVSTMAAAVHHRPFRYGGGDRPEPDWRGGPEFSRRADRPGASDVLSRLRPCRGPHPAGLPRLPVLALGPASARSSPAGSGRIAAGDRGRGVRRPGAGAGGRLQGAWPARAGPTAGRGAGPGRGSGRGRTHGRSPGRVRSTPWTSRADSARADALPAGRSPFARSRSVAADRPTGGGGAATGRSRRDGGAGVAAHPPGGRPGRPRRRGPSPQPRRRPRRGALRRTAADRPTAGSGGRRGHDRGDAGGGRSSAAGGRAARRRGRRSSRDASPVGSPHCTTGCRRASVD